MPFMSVSTGWNMIMRRTCTTIMTAAIVLAKALPVLHLVPHDHYVPAWLESVDKK